MSFYLGGEAIDFPAGFGFLVTEAIVEAAGAALPEFDEGGFDSEATPVGRAGDFLVLVLAFEFFEAVIEDVAVRDRLALVGCPGSEATIVGAAVEVLVGFFGADFFGNALDADLAFEFVPEEGEGGVGICYQLLAFVAVVVGEEGKATRIYVFKQDDAGGGDALGGGGGEGHGVGFGEFGF